MKLAVNNLIVPLSLTMLSLQMTPLSAQSLSDAVGNQQHVFARTNVSAPPSAAKSTWTKHHAKNSEKPGLTKHHATDTTAPVLVASAQVSNQPTVAAVKSATGVKHKLTPAQIAHHLKMLALKAAHKKAQHNALNGFDQVGSSTTASLDSMTRDGAQASSSPSSLATKDLSIGGAVGRAIASLVLVLGLAYGALKVMRKRGIGIAGNNASNSDIDFNSPDLQLHSEGPSTLDQFQLAIEKAQSRQGQVIDTTVQNGYQQVSKSIDGLEVLGTQELPGTAHTLYKVKIGDRILLLGGSLSGALTALTEWDVETKPETEQQFETVLNQMTMSVTPPVSAPIAPTLTSSSLAGGSQADALRTATQRLSRSARRMAETGRAAANDAG